MADDPLTIFTDWHRDEATDTDEAREYAQRLYDRLTDNGYTIVRTADIDLAERKSAHGCTDAPCGECDR
jgi:hypothetical protein